MKKLWLLLALTLFIPAHATAQNKKTGGITISPASQEIVVKKDEGEKGGSFMVINNNDVVETFELSTVDMGALDDTGGVAFSGLSQDYQRKYGLAKWVVLSRNLVTIAPKGRETVAFTIKNDDSLSPGGHYGALIVRRARDRGGEPKRRIALSPEAASLLFLRKVGGEVYGLALTRISSNDNLWHLPSEVNLPFKNEGNTHVVPRGIVRIKTASGEEIAKGIINPESSVILPEHTRNFTVTLRSQTRVIWPGKYHVEVAYRYDGREHFSYQGTTFYTANLRVVMMGLGVLAILSLVIYKTRRHIRKFSRRVRRIFRWKRRA